ncbi:MAG: complex I NDUFA9 subunit family protein [Rhodobacteraceae bacterium]|nr:complex I NDUFA9 subunit family protein [Paracoccaceae bacterium]
MGGLVTVYGGSGFIGRYIVRGLAREGWRVRIAVRRPNEAGFLRTCGVVGQVEPVLCNVRDDASVATALAGADAVVNCVGILTERGRNRFGPVQGEAPGRIARAAAAAGVGRLVHLSAIGADRDGPSRYARSKAEGEERLVAHFPAATILRPSIVFGPEDRFFNRFAAMARLTPVLPVVGAGTRFQPVHVGDVAAAAVIAVRGGAEAGVHELGGPEVLTFRACLERMLAVIERRRLILGLPFALARVMAAPLELAQAVTLGLVHNSVLTRDQVANLARDCIVTPGRRGLAGLGITPTALDAVLPAYLWPYRPSGQFAAIRRSALGLHR